MKRIILALIFMNALALPLPALAGGCSDPGANRLAAVINIGAATTTQIAAAPLQAGQRILLCNVAATLAGTTPSITLVYGTGTNCATNQGSLTGAMAPTSGSILVFGYGDDLIPVPPGNALCGTTAGTGSSFQGTAVYVLK